jgi:hypothetical protein
MKTIVLAAVAALGLATSAVAGGTVEPQPRPVIVEAPAPDSVASVSITGAMPFDHSTNVQDNWALRGDVRVLEYALGEGTSTVTLFGEYGALGGDEFYTAGGEYAWAYTADRTTFTLAGEAAWFGLDGFDGVWLATPSVNVSYAVTDNFSAFAEAGYTWNMSQDWTAQGGYAEVGGEYGFTDNLFLRGSVVQPFDTVDDDPYAQIELRLEF